MNERLRTVLVLTLAFLAATFSYRYLAGLKETDTVVITAADIPAGTKIESAMLSTVTVSKQERELLAPLAIREPAQVLGRATKRSVRKGSVLNLDPDEFLLDDEALRQATNGTVPPAYLLPPGRVAIAVAVDAESAVGYMLQKGDLVNVIVTGKRGDEVISKTILAEIPVFDVGHSDGGGLGGADRNAFKTVTLLVTPTDAEKVANGKRTGKIDLALAGRHKH